MHLWGAKMESSILNSAESLIIKIQSMFRNDLALENDFLKIENKILRSKMEKRPILIDSDRKLLVKYGLRIKDRLKDVISIVKPETLLKWHRNMIKKKWTFNHNSTFFVLPDFCHMVTTLGAAYNRTWQAAQGTGPASKS